MGGYVERLQDFNPRSPCGERLVSEADAEPAQVFQSTLPVWGATGMICISIRCQTLHSPLPVWGAT